MWHSAWRWLYPGLRIKRWVLLFSVGLLLLVLGLTTIINYQVFGVLEEFLFRVLYEMTGRYNYTLLAGVGAVLIIVGALVMIFSFQRLMQRILQSIAPEGSGKVSQMMLTRTAGSGAGDRLHRRRYRPFETAARFENENVPFDSDRDRRRRRRFIGPPTRGNGHYRAGRFA